MKKIRVFEAFAGIGAVRMALERLGGGVECDYIGISEIDKFAVKSYEAIHGKTKNYGDISKIDVKELPDFDLFVFGFPCFTGDSLVLTDKGYKEIKDIEPGEMVLTHDNTYKKALKKFDNGEQETVIVKAMGIDEIKTTKDHKFYARKMYRKYNNDIKQDERKFEDPKWARVKDLKRNDYLGIAINNKAVLPKWEGVEFERDTNIAVGIRKVKRNNIKGLLEDERLWWLIGRYVADGWIRSQGGIVIAVGKNKYEEFKEKIGDLFPYTEAEERTSYKFHFTQKELEEFVKPIGRGAANKEIPGFILDLPEEHLKSFLKGYFSGDGCKVGKLYKCTSVSRKLVYGLGQCIAKVYKRPYSIYKTIRPKTTTIEGRVVNQKDTYQLTFKKENDKQDKAFYEDGYIWYPFREIEQGKKEKVYDLQVEDNHSYTVQNIIVHNCQDLSLAGLQKGFKKGSETRSSLLWECEKIIEEKRPKYLLMENVKALTFKKNMPGFEMWLKILEDLGYTNYWKILNAKDYGVPQNRERVFCISIHGDHDEYEFPEGEKLTKRLRDVLEEEVDEKYYLRPEQIEMLTKRDTGKYNRRKNFLKNIDKEEDVANTVQTRQRTSPDDTYVVDEETVERIKNEY